MKITYQWLREFCEVVGSPADVAKQLTLEGLEVEAVTPAALAFSNVIVGTVLGTTRHPDAEKLSVCDVTTDGSNRLQIICGAPNVRAGLRVAVAMVGAELPNGVSISRAKLRGLESAGMLCSARELGLGEEHDGIMELPQDLALGTAVRDALDLDDSILEVNATPNRGDCMSVFGVARDYAAAVRRQRLTYSVPAVAPTIAERLPSASQVAGCPLFTSRVIRNIKPGIATPMWLRERLRRCGINSISPVVDITNYVAHELGQPMHAYDLTTLNGGLEVRMAKQGEVITLLDLQRYELDADFMVVGDANGPVGLAGIMGGLHSAISATTTDVLVECAHFTPDGVAGRARRLGLFTDAAQRYERGVDPTLPLRAQERAAQLILEIVGGDPGPVQIVLSSAAVKVDADVLETVSLRRARLGRLLGCSIPDAEVDSIMNALSDDVTATSDGWRLRRPSHRFDIRIEADLIEEVARLRGFDSIVERHATAPQAPGPAPENHVGSDRLLSAMADRGYREVITYTFVDPKIQQTLFPDATSLTLANPISNELSTMRVSLWCGLVDACRENSRRQQSRVRLFEIGKKFLNTDLGLDEVECLAGIATGSRLPEQWGVASAAVDFFDIKGDLQSVLALADRGDRLRFEAAALSCLRPGRSARIYRNAAPIGWIGELHPLVLKALGLPTTAWVFELESEIAFAAKNLTYKGISKFPRVRRDLAIVIDESVPLAVLQENVTVSASGLLSDLRVFDVYRGPNVETGRKSVALGLILQDSSRTLTDDDADRVVAAVTARLRDVLSATIRDQ